MVRGFAGMSQSAERNPVPPAIPVSPEAPAAPVEPVDLTPLPKRRIWTVGTLTYTTAGLMMVVFWLLVADAGLNLRDRLWSDTLNLLLRRLGASNTALAVLTVILSGVIALLV